MTELPMLNVRGFFRPLIISIAALLCISIAQAAECEKPGHLRFSFVPQSDVQTEIEALQPLFDELQLALGMSVDVVTPSSYGAVIEGLLAGTVDLARLGPAAYISAKKQDPGITAFATVARKNPAQPDEDIFYRSILIVRKNSPYKTIESLRGKKVALVDPDSTSGALIPRHVFSKQIGLPLEKYFSQVVYSGAHDQSMLNLSKKRVDAAFISSTILAVPVESGKIKNDAFRTLWTSKPIPRNPFVLRNQLCSDLKRKIISVFLERGGNANKNLMQNLNVMRFVPIGDQDYEILRNLP
ncbi:phosphate/phosphite/phosphonate ABC transporter substrate-binding protein [Herminiimonas fonticola]|uniref:phosphate/phosphite/phosphonate ABC transporter substrate-binding protein n=1 Tax=Herminiimonas fonticola TaxID=303380 RepID=UPI00333F923C